MDRRKFVMGGLSVPFIATGLPAFAGVAGMSAPMTGDWRVVVDKSRQIMDVMYNGEVVDEWLVSTARRGKVTPTGTFSPYWLSRNHRSKRYNNTPMPFAIFYSGHYAVHGTYSTNQLGNVASAGCVRLHPDNAAFLFEVPRRFGLKALEIVIV